MIRIVAVLFLSGWAASSARAQSVSVLEWDFASAGTSLAPSGVNPAVSTSNALAGNGSITLAKVASAPLYLSAGSVWLGTEDTTYYGPRTSLTPKTGKSISTTFTLGSQANGDWSNLSFSFKYSRPTTAPNRLRAVLTWQEGAAFKRAYTAAFNLTGSAWSPTSTGKFQSGDALPTSFYGKQFLLEIYCWGTSTTPNGIFLDDVKILCNSLNASWTMTPATLASWPAGKAYSLQPAIVNYTGAITWTVSAGSLPAGLSLNATTGAVTGTTFAVGASSFSLTATGAGLSKTTAYTLNITAAPAGLPPANTLAKWTFDGDTDPTVVNVPAQVDGSVTEVSWGYDAGGSITGGISTGGSGASSSTPVNAAAGGAMRSFAGWDASSTYSTARASLTHFNSGTTPRFAVAPAANTANIPTASQTSTGQRSALQMRLTLDPNATGDLTAFYFDGLRWAKDLMTTSGANGPRWAQLRAYWTDASGTVQRWDSDTKDISSIFYPEHRAVSQFGRYWFDLDADGTTGLNAKIKATAAQYKSRAIFFDLYFWHDTGADLSGMTGANPPSILIDEMGVTGSILNVPCPSQLATYDLIVRNNLAIGMDIEGRAVVNNITSNASFTAAKLVGGYSSRLNMYVQGNVVAGGSINFQYGSLYIPATSQLNSRTINYNGGGSTVTSPAFDFTSVFNAVVAESTNYNYLATNSTATIPSSTPAQAVLNVVSTLPAGGVAVFSVDGNTLFNNSNVQNIDINLNGTSPAYIVINVTGTTIAWSNSGDMVGTLASLALRSKLMWNFPQATSVTMNHQLFGALMAPLATVSNAGGAFSGPVAVNNLNAGVAVQLPLFQGGVCPPTFSIGDRVWFDANNNGTQDASEVGISGVALKLFQSGKNPTVDTPVATTTTNAGGNYVFSNLAAGSYFIYIPTPPAAYPSSSTLQVNSDSHINTDNNGVQTGKGLPITSPVIALALGTEPTNDGDTDSNTDLSVDFGLTTSMSIGNLVWADTNNNGIKDATETGLGGVTVQLFNPGADNVVGTGDDSQVGSNVTTGVTGSYSFTGLAPGKYYVKVTPTTSYPVTGGTPVTLDNDVDNNNDGSQPGGAATAIFSPIITLAAGAESITDGDTDVNTNLSVDFGLFTGFTVGNLVFADVNNNGIKDAAETGIGSLTVELLNSAGASFVPAVTTTTNASGAYGFTVYTAGTYKIKVTPNGSYPRASSTVGIDNGTDNNNDGSQPGGAGAAATSFAFTLTAGGEPGTAGTANAENTIDFGFTTCPTITITPATWSTPTVGTAFTQTLTAAGGSPSYTWSVSSGTLPTGLSLSAGGVITGTPQNNTPQTFTIKATDSALCFGTLSYTITPFWPSDLGDWNGSGAASATTSSYVSSSLRMGGTVDGELTVTPDAAATADGTDEDGVTMPASISAGASVTIPVSVFNNSGANAFLNAWIDFNSDGTFSDTVVSAGGERLSAPVTVASSASVQSLSFTFVVPATASIGLDRGVRFRLTNQAAAATTPTGAVGVGEVEDYTVDIGGVGGGLSSTACNVYAPLAAPTHNNLTVKSSQFLFADQFSNKANLIDSSTTNNSSFGYLIGGSAWIEVKDNLATGANAYPSGSYAGFYINDSGLAGLSNSVTITLYQAGVQKQTKTFTNGLGSALLDLGGGSYRVGMIATSSFDTIRLTYNALGVVGTVNVYQAEVLVPCAGPLPACNVVTHLNRATYPAIIEASRSGLDGLSFGSVSNLDNATNSDTNDYATLSLNIGIAASASISVRDMATTYPAGYYAGIELSSQTLAGVSLLGSSQVSTYLNGVLQETALPSRLLVSVPLVQGTGREVFGFITTKPFNEICYHAKQVIGLDLGSTRIYGAVVKRFCPGPVMVCGQTYWLTEPTHPVVIDGARTGFSGVASVGCNISNTPNIISASATDFATITVDAGVLTSAAITVANGADTYPAGSIAGFAIEDANNLLNVDLFPSVTITTFKSGVQQESKTSTQLVDLAVLVSWIGTGPGRHNVGFMTSLPFDSIQIRVSSLASVLNSIRVYGSYVDTRYATSICNDFGDWNGSGAATATTSSAVNPNLRLGATVDGEASATPNAGATADGADEDSVTIPTSIPPGSSVTIPVSVFNNTGSNAYLNAWIDFNNNGTFSDTVLAGANGGERLAAPVTVASGASMQTINITFTVPAAASLGAQRGVRFRLTDQATTAPVGAVGTGEVEDYVVDIGTPGNITVGNLVWADTNQNGLFDAGESGLDGVTVELKRAGSVVATAVTAGGGLYSFTVPPNTDYSLNIPTPPASYPFGWYSNDYTDDGVDNNGDGYQPGGAGTAVWTGSFDLTANGEPGIAGATNAENTWDFAFRAVPNPASLLEYTFETSSTPLAPAVKNVCITSPSLLQPVSGGNGLSIAWQAGGGAPIRTGAKDIEVGGQAASYNTALEATRSSLTPVTQTMHTTFSFATGSTGSIGNAYVDICPSATPDYVRFFLTWFDGTAYRTAWTDTVTAAPASSGGPNFWVSVEGSFVNGTPLPTGAALAGKTFLLELAVWGSNPTLDNLILGGTCVAATNDYGDWNGSGAQTTTTYSTVNQNIRLGAAVDAELTVAPNIGATADGSDEDGVTMPASFAAGATVTIPVSVLNNSGSNAYLNGWMDFNNDGTFNDTVLSGTNGGERLVAPIMVASGATAQTVNVTFVAPGNASVGIQRGVRFRLTNQAVTLPTGAVGSGEVEDYVVTITAPGNIVVGNLVWNDANQNGVKDAGESGINGVTVQLWRDTVLAGTTLTSGGGLYSFSVPPNMGYHLKIPNPPAAFPFGNYSNGATDNGVDNNSDGYQPAGAGGPVSTGNFDLTTNGEPGTAGATNADTTWDFGFRAVPNPPSLVEYNFEGSSTPATPSAKHAAVTSASILQPVDGANGLAVSWVAGSISPMRAGAKNIAATGQASTYNSALEAARTSLTPVTQTFYTTLTFASGAAGTIGSGYVDILPSGTPDNVRFFLTWHDGTAYRTAWTNTVVASPGYWTTVQAPFVNGTALPTGAGLAGRTFLLEVAVWGSNPTLDNVILGGTCVLNSSDRGDWSGGGAQTNSTASLVDTNLRLGASVDSEASVTPDTTATADGADEDGVTMPASMTQGASVTIPVSVFNSTGANAYLSAWIDFNNDGAFNDTVVSSGGERLEAIRTIATGATATTQNITFTVPSAASSGPLRGVRFRLTNQSTTPPVGQVGVGEVEDYTATVNSAGGIFSCNTDIYIVQNEESPVGSGNWTAHFYRMIAGPSLQELGSYPGKRLNGLANSGGSYYVVDSDGTHLYKLDSGGGLLDLGAVTGLPTPTASQQWSGATCLANGRILLNLGTFSPSVQTDLYTVDVGTVAVIGSPVTCLNASGAPLATNFGDIVWDSMTNRVYGMATTDVSVAGLTEIDTVTGRCTRLAPSTLLAYGSLGCDSSGNVYGYGTASGSGAQDTLYSFGRTGGLLNGSYTAIGTGPAVSSSDGASCPGAMPSLVIGNLVWADTNNNGIKDASELGISGVGLKLFREGQNPSLDTPVATTTTDSDGLYIFGGLAPGRYFVVIETAPAAYPVSSGTVVTLDNAVDNDNNGSQSVAGGRVTGPVIALYGKSESITDGDTSSNTDLTVDFGFHALVLDTKDYGDAPASYGIADHTVVAGLSLGALVDKEAASLSNAAATGDDADGVDDEDGVFFDSPIIPSSTARIVVGARGQGYLNMWIDWNRDGDFADAGEHIVTDQLMPVDTDGNASPAVLRIPVPAGASLGSTYVRARYTSATGTGATGSGADGEVEDYNVTIVPGASVAGRVWKDNNNGIQDGGEAGLASFPVILYRQDGKVEAITLSDSAGAYSFSALPAGLYYVGVDLPNAHTISVMDQGGNDNLDNDFDSATNQTALFALVTGEAIAHVDAGVNVPANTITYSAITPLALTTWTNSFNVPKLDPVIGTPTAVQVRSIVHEVQDLLFENTGISGEVSNFSLSNGFTVTLPDATTLTTSAVYNSTSALPPWDGSVDYHGSSGDPAYDITRLTRRGSLNYGTPATFAGTGNIGLSGTGDFSFSQSGGGNSKYSLSTYAAGIVSVTYTYNLPTLTIGNLVFADKNCNGVKDAGETGIGGVTVQLFNPGADNIIGTADDAQVGANFVTGVTGAYQFSGLSAGKYYVKVTPTASYPLTGGTPASLDDDVDNNNDGSQPGGAGTAIYSPILTLTQNTESITDGDTDANTNLTVDFGLCTPLSVGNLVWYDANNNGIKDAAEVGIGGLTVELLNNLGVSFVPAVTTTTNASGAYGFNVFVPGDYKIKVTPSVSYPRSSTAIGTDNGTDNDNNGSQPSGAGNPAISIPFRLAFATEPGTTGTTSTDNTIDFGFTTCPTISVTPGTLPAATIGVAYSQTLTASGSAAPYTWSVSTGTLPAGLSLSGAGVLSGTPTSATSQTFTISAADSAGCKGTLSYTLAPGCPTLTIAPAALPAANVGQAYSQALTSGGGNGTLAWAITSGSLPAGLTLNAATGVISGTAPVTASSSAITVRVTDGFGCLTTQSYTFTVVGLSLGNLVWSDTNGNGVRDVGEPGAAGAVVQLYTLGTDGLPFTADDVQVGASQTTPADGSYRFDNIAPGTYCVKVTPPAGLPVATSNPVNLDNGIDNDSNGSQPGGAGTVLRSPVITLAAGSEPTSEDSDSNTDLTVDFGVFQGMQIGNLVWSDTNANGTRDAGELGISGVVVQLFSTGLDGKIGGADDANLMFTTTNASGEYTFSGLLPGRYYVRLPSPPTSTPLASPVAVTSDNGVDNDSNGVQIGGAAIYSPVISLASLTEPGSSGSTNNDLTIDFGLVGASLGAFTSVANDDALHVYHPDTGAFCSVFQQPFGGNNSQGNGDTGDTPGGIELGPDGNWYVAHPGTGNIRKISAAGVDQGLVLSTLPGIARLSKFAFGPDGNFYALDPSGSRVVRFGGPLNGSVGTPLDASPYTFIAKTARDIAFGPDSNIYLVVDTGSTWQVERYNGITGAYMNTIVTAAQVGSMVSGGNAFPVISGIDIRDTVMYGVTTGEGEVFKVSLTDPASPGSPALVADLDTAAYGPVDTEDLKLNPATAKLFVCGYRWVRTVKDGSFLSSALIKVDPAAASSAAPVFCEAVMPTAPGPANESFPGVRDVAFGARTCTAATICSIGSQIWNDLNYDSVYQAGEPGIGNVKLELWYDANNNLTDGCEQVVGWTYTDGSGHYRFDGLVPGRYQVAVTPSNFDVGAPLFVFCLSIPGTNNVDNGIDGDDNGMQPGGHGTPTTSPIITLTATGETLGDGASGAEWAGGGDLDTFLGDSNGDMTIDFAFSLPGTLVLGNLVYVDYNGNNRYDDGEGADGVLVELYFNGQTPGVSLPIATAVTSNGGRYLFPALVPGDYTVLVPPSNFATNGPLRGMFSVPDTAAGDDNVGEKGVDVVSPETTGVRCAPVRLDYGACATAATGETGLDSATDDSNDGDTDLTVDFGFYTRVGVGNLVFFDSNGDGIANTGEGVSGVTVQLYRDGQTPETDTPLASTVTNSQGKYVFVDLQPGYYVVHIPSTMFQTGQPLKGYSSIAEGKQGDDIVGEDGLNTTTPSTQGVSCAPVLLMAGQAPTSLNGETGFDAASDDVIDAAIDLTVDFGFSRPVSVGNLVYFDANSNGHYDTGEGVANVKIELYSTGSTPGFSIPVRSMFTESTGHYKFTGLPGGNYFVFIPGAMFQATKPLFNKMSMPSVAVANADDSKGEHGQDTGNPSATGIRTDDFLVAAGSCPVNSATTASTGENGFMATEDDANDNDGNMTIDLGFSVPDLTKVGVGNAVYSDLNGNYRYDDGEGVVGATVRLYASTVTTPTESNALAATTTDSTGGYYFGNLSPGNYYIVIPALNFANDGKLKGQLSLTGNGGDDGIDDDQDENGIDDANYITNGIRSSVFNLQPGTMPTDFDSETGKDTYVDDGNDANNNMTIDFGFYTPVGVGNLVFMDANGNGHADTGEGVGGVTVQLFHAADDYVNATPVATLVTSTVAATQGQFMFTGLMPGDYYLHIPASQFGTSKPLFGAITLPGAQTDIGDDNTGEDGVDPVDIVGQGISTGTIALRPGTMPFGTVERGLFGSADDAASYGDKNYDMTWDFGFYSNVKVGNLVFKDVDADGKYTDGTDTGISGVTVEIYRQDTVLTTPVLSGTTTTDTAGRYLFSMPAGNYFIKIPSSMFTGTKPLAHLKSTVPGLTGDDDVGQDATDTGNPGSTGAKTAIFTLAVGTMPTTANGETGFDSTTDDLIDNVSNLTIDLGFKAAPLGVGNLVFRDPNDNGKFNAANSFGIGGVTMRLFRLGDNPATSTPVSETTSLTNGTYLLTTASPGFYFVHVPKSNFAAGAPLVGMISSSGNSIDGKDDNQNENGIDSSTTSASGISSFLFYLGYGLAPTDSGDEKGFAAVSDNGADSDTNLTIDFGFRIAPPGAPLAGLVRRDLTSSGVIDPNSPPLAGVELSLFTPVLAPNGAATLEPVCTTTTAADGSYCFDNLNSGTYVVVQTPLPGAVPTAATGAVTPDRTAVAITNATGVSGVDFMQSLSPDSFALWQAQHAADGDTSANANADGDLYDNLMTYALGLDSTGIRAKAPFTLQVNAQTGSVDAVLTRRTAGHADIVYSLEGAAGSSWTRLAIVPAVEANADGSETVRYPDVASQPVFAGASLGYVRLKVALDADLNGTPESTSTSPVFAFDLLALPAAQTTFSMPLLKNEVFSGKAGAVTDHSITIASAGLKDALTAGRSYFIEVLDGTHEGERYELDEAATAGDSIAIESGSIVPSDLTGARIVARPHWTLGDTLPAGRFHAGRSSSTADRVMFFEGGAYKIHWLMASAAGSRWVADGDTTLKDTGTSRLIGPATGLIVHARGGALTLPLVGQVRANAFAVSLSAGPQLVGTGWPVAQSPAARGMTTANGFAVGDAFRLWAGDAAPSATGYLGHLMGAGDAWARDDDATLTNLSATPVFAPFHASFIVPAHAVAWWKQGNAFH